MGSLQGGQQREALLLALLVDERLVLQLEEGWGKQVGDMCSGVHSQQRPAAEPRQLTAAAGAHTAGSLQGTPGVTARQRPPTGHPLTMWGMTPPPAMVALISVSSSSSPRIASCKWRGVMRFTFRSLEALPASSSTCCVR